MFEILMLHFRHKIVKTANRLMVTTAMKKMYTM